MQHASRAIHVVKGFLPCDIHHALHALLVARHETWQEWLMAQAKETLEGKGREEEESPDDQTVRR